MKSFFEIPRREIFITSPTDHSHARPNRYHLFTVNYIIKPPKHINGIQSNIWFSVDSYPFYFALLQKTFPILNSQYQCRSICMKLWWHKTSDPSSVPLRLQHTYPPPPPHACSKSYNNIIEPPTPHYPPPPPYNRLSVPSDCHGSLGSPLGSHALSSYLWGVRPPVPLVAVRTPSLVRMGPSGPRGYHFRCP